MRKMMLFNLSIVLLFLIFLPNVFADSVLDQQQTQGGSEFIFSNIGDSAQQTFVPQYNKLDKIELRLKRNIPSQPVTQECLGQFTYKFTVSTDSGEKTITKNMMLSNTYTDVIFDLSPDASVIKGNTYWMKIEYLGTTFSSCVGKDVKLQWERSTSPSSYSSGSSSDSKGQSNNDFTFKTYATVNPDFAIVDAYTSTTSGLTGKNTKFEADSYIYHCVEVKNKGGVKGYVDIKYIVNDKTIYTSEDKEIPAGETKGWCYNEYYNSDKVGFYTFKGKLDTTLCSVCESASYNFEVYKDCTPQTWYYDGDGDGYGISSNTKTQCDKPSGYADKSGDCNDGNSAKYQYLSCNYDGNSCLGVYQSICTGSQCPTKPAEICGNNIDDNCDGNKDENCVPNLDITNVLATPNPINAGNDLTMKVSVKNYGASGSFKRTFKILKNGALAGDNTEWWKNFDINSGEELSDTISLSYTIPSDWSGTYELVATIDKCSAPNDCTASYFFTVNPSCTDYDGDGYCANSGQIDCNDNLDYIHPNAEELCNTYDDDCDGTKNENVIQYVLCGLNGGQQKQVCNQNGGWDNSGTCSDNSVCTNGDKKQCGATDVGECSYGTDTCVNGKFSGVCAGEIKSTSETCNNKDDNCDGKIDDNLICNTNENCGSYGNPCADGYTCVSGTCQWTSNNHFIIYNAPTQEIEDKALEYLEQSYALLTASFDKSELWSTPIIVNFVVKNPSDNLFEKNAWFNGVYGLSEIGIEIYYPSDYQSKQNQEPNKFNYDLQIALSHEFTHLLMQQVGGPHTSEGLADWGTYAVFSLDSHDYLNSYKWALCDANVAEFPLENYYTYEEETSKNIKRSMARDLYIDLFDKDASMFKSYISVYKVGIGDENNKRKSAITSMYISKYFDFSKNYEQVIEFIFPCPDAIVLEKDDYIKLYTELKKANLISSMSYYSTENIAQSVMNTQNEYISSMSDTPTPITPKIKKQLSIIGLGTKELLTKKNIQALKANIENEDEINKIINDIYKTKDEGTVDNVLLWGKKEVVKKVDTPNVQKLPGILKIAGFALYFSYKLEECGEPITAIVYGAIDAAKGALLAPVEGGALIIWGGTTAEKMIACPDVNTPECEYIKKTNEYAEFYLDITEKTLGQCLNFPKYACVPSNNGQTSGQVCYTPNTINPLNIEQVTIKDDEDVSFNVKLINNANSWDYSYQHPTGLYYIFTQIFKDDSYFYLDASIINKETEEHIKDYPTKTVDLIDLAPKFGEPLNKEKTILFEATKVPKNKEYLFKADVWWCGDKSFAKPGQYGNCEQVGEISKPFILENQLPIINSVTCNSMNYLGVQCPIFSKESQGNEEVFGNKIDILAGDKLTMTLTAHDVDGSYLEVSYAGDYTSQFKNIGCVDTNDGVTGKICTFTFTPTQNDIGKSNYYVNFAVKDDTEQIIETYSFNIKENSPKIISPKTTDANKGVTQSQEPLFEWYNIAGDPSAILPKLPIRYFIRIYTSAASENPLFTSEYMEQVPGTTETLYQLDTSLNKDKEYWWKVTSLNEYDVELNSTKEKFYVDCWTDDQCVIDEPSVFTCENGAAQEEKKVGYCEKDPSITEFSYCTSKIEKTKNDCPYGCSDGTCLPKQDNIFCYNDKECPQKTENYCLGNDVYTKITGACIDDGLTTAYCDNSNNVYPTGGEPALLTKCNQDEICSNAQCIPNPALIVCKEDKDCSSKTDYFCSGDNKKVDYSVHNGLCMNAGKTNSYCDYYPPTPPETSKVCNADEICSNINGNAGCIPKPSDPDTDTDGIPDKTDNCISAKNPDQKDSDLDGKGDACDDDNDNDAVLDNKDNCVQISNKDQKDNDLDGKGDACDDDNDNDGVVNTNDCSPLNKDISPNKQEICNNVDDDCDGTVDEGVTIAQYKDDDFDGYGNKNENPIPTCKEIAGYAPTNDDCDDTANSINPDVQEVCNNVDDNCDGQIDKINNEPICAIINDVDSDGIEDTQDNCPQKSNTQQEDYDKDGFGDVCDFDKDGDGAFNLIDCAPMDSKINPFAKETCNYQDEDCDGIIDEGFDFMNDNNNCGICGWSCGKGNYCNEGKCTKIEGTCEKSTDCKEDENCVNNLCELKEGCKYDNPSCSSGEICADNVCIEDVEELPSQLPDLYATSPKLLQLKWDNGNECKAVFEFVVENKGETEAENIKWVAETNIGQYLTGNKNPIPKIKKGKEVLIVPQFKFSGTLQPVFYVDKENTVAELDENNNFLSYTSIECDYNNGFKEGSGNEGYKDAKENGNADSSAKRSAKKSAADYSKQIDYPKSSLWKKVMDEREKMKRDKDDDVKYAYDTGKKKADKRKTNSEKADIRE